MKNVSLKSYHLEFQFVSSRSCLLQWLLQWLLLITMFCFLIFQYKAKLVRKQRCKFKASFFFLVVKRFLIFAANCSTIPSLVKLSPTRFITF